MLTVKMSKRRKSAEFTKEGDFRENTWFVRLK